MRLLPGGIDVFYIDESHDTQHYVVTAVTVPMLRNIDKIWHITWPDHLAAAKAWRAEIAKTLKIPRHKELHASKLLSGSGQFRYGKWQFKRDDAARAYRQILATINFVPSQSIFSVAAKRGHSLYGATRLEAAMHALFQRMRKQCRARMTNAIVFFDEGHPEYRSLYRKAQTYLETGSSWGGWADGSLTKSAPLDMFFKDGNDKVSKFCLFTQTADLIAYAAFLKVKAEASQLADWQQEQRAGQLYDVLPVELVNRHVQIKSPRDGIVRLW